MLLIIFIQVKVAGKGDDFDMGKNAGLGSDSAKKNYAAPPQFHRGYSSKNPKMNNLMEPTGKSRFAMQENDSFDEEEAEFMRETRHHNFHPNGVVKPVSKDYDYDINTEEDLIRL